VKFVTAAAPGIVLKYVEDKCETADEKIHLIFTAVGSVSYHISRGGQT
jgi:hypothetical protein